MDRQNLFSGRWDGDNEELRTRHRIFWRPGHARMGATLYELAPGAPETKMHMHFGAEEMFFVLSGRPVFRNQHGEEELAPGDFVFCPEGRAGLHTFSNRAAEPAQILAISAGGYPDVVAYPAPSAALDKFGEGSLIFILRGWTKTERYESVSQSLTLAINKAFQDAGIQIPFTQSDVHLHLPEKAGSELPSVEKLNQAAAGVAASPKSTAGS